MKQELAGHIDLDFIIVCVINGQYVGIEVKGPKGRQSENQQGFQRQLEAAEGKYILAYSIDDVERGLVK